MAEAYNSVTSLPSSYPDVRLTAKEKVSGLCYTLFTRTGVYSYIGELLVADK